MKGEVKFFNVNKGFGFITGDDDKEYFVHQTGIKGGIQLNEGDKVTFDVVQGDRGPKAENVTIAKSEDVEEKAEEVTQDEPEETEETADKVTANDETAEPEYDSDKNLDKSEEELEPKEEK